MDKFDGMLIKAIIRDAKMEEDTHGNIQPLKRFTNWLINTESTKSPI